MYRKWFNKSKIIPYFQINHYIFFNIKTKQQPNKGVIIFVTVDGSIITLTKYINVNNYQLFDTDMTCLTQFRNDNILIAGGVILLY